MRTVVLAYLEPGDAAPDAVVQQVAEALKESGHETFVMTIQDDVRALVAGIEEHKPALVFNLVESFGDDILGGTMGVAGVLELLEQPYTGGGPGEIFLQEDKGLAKKLLAFEQIPYPDFATFAPTSEFETGGKLRMPLFVKPLRMDASIGIDQKSLVRNTQELMERVLYIQTTFGDAALAEEFIEGREFYVGLHIMDKDAKFNERSERFLGTHPIVPDLDPELRARLQKVSLEAYRALRVRDYGRVDLRLAETGEIFVIEVNANCYLENTSEFAMAAKADGIEYSQLVSRIAELALERWKQRGRAQRKRKRAREAST